MELSVLSVELDRRMIEKLDPDAPISVAAYCDAFRALSNREERLRQVALIVQVGRSLDRYVAKPMLRSALAVMRAPARAAGFAALQTFLERGVSAFRQMRGAAAFLATIETRETALVEAIFAGDRAPFTEP
jgi:hypothetical protein